MTQYTTSCDSCFLASDSPCSFRPGGLELTKRLLQAVDLDETSRVLDIACGCGTTAVFIAEQYRSSVVGIDISPTMIHSSKNNAEAKGLSRKISLVTGSAEHLPFPGDTFDIVINECSFTLADSRRTAGEMARVLKHGGKELNSNVYLREDTSGAESDTSFSISCLAIAKPLAEQVSCLTESGFRDIYTEDHSRVLKEMALRLIMQKGLKKFPGGSRAASPAQFFKTRKYGYSIITGTKP